MNIDKIEDMVITNLNEYCRNHQIDTKIDLNTSLIGENRIFDSLGLVSFIVDTEMNFLEIGIDLSLTSENALSLRISPFRTVGSLCRFIENQITKQNE